MTITEFIGLLEVGGWRLDADGNLMDCNEYCPLWHVYHEYYDRWDEEVAEDYVEAGRRCGLRTRDAVAITEAADNRSHPRLRKRLLAAVGINAKGPTP